MYTNYVHKISLNSKCNFGYIYITLKFENKKVKLVSTVKTI